MDYKKLAPWIGFLSIIMIVSPNLFEVIQNPLISKGLTIGGIIGLMVATVISGKMDKPYYKGFLVLLAVTLFANIFY